MALAGDAEQVARIVEREGTQLHGSYADDDTLMDLVGDARLVLLGEATHGTHEFYAARSRITRRLIREKGFNAVAVEADWPDAHRVDRYVRWLGPDETAVQALGDFTRFPIWMWRNADVAEFVEWLRDHNAGREAQDQVMFYGLDLYSMYRSMSAVIDYLEEVDPQAARVARDRYDCFGRLDADPQRYGLMASLSTSDQCRRQVLAQLREMEARSLLLIDDDDDPAARDAWFVAMRNAALARNAEEYYRQLFLGDVSAWNLRDQHMAETLTQIMAHLQVRSSRGHARVVVWAHNSHLGDARATEMADVGELNLGQLARQRFGGDAVLVGFTTYTGSVAAAHEWGGPVQHMQMNPALGGSWEHLFHETGVGDFMLKLRDQAREVTHERRLQRAIGVVYRPDRERQSHYLYTRLSPQFDAVIHFDQTRAVQPLDAVTVSRAAA